MAETKKKTVTKKTTKKDVKNEAKKINTKKVADKVVKKISSTIEDIKINTKNNTIVKRIPWKETSKHCHSHSCDLRYSEASPSLRGSLHHTKANKALP